jgi:hypothetical protein
MVDRRMDQVLAQMEQAWDMICDMIADEVNHPEATGHDEEIKEAIHAGGSEAEWRANNILMLENIKWNLVDAMNNARLYLDDPTGQPPILPFALLV